MSEDIKRDELDELIDFLFSELLASQTEIAKGTGISRPKIIEYFKEKEQTKLPHINRNRIIELYKEIIKNKPSSRTGINKTLSQPEFEKKRKQAERYREILKFLDSPDEFLLAGKYLPELAMNVRVSPTIYPAVAQIATMLELFPIEEALYCFIDFKSSLNSKLTTTTNKFFNPEKGEERQIKIDPLLNEMMIEITSIIQKEITPPIDISVEQRFTIQGKLLKKYSQAKKSQIDDIDDIDHLITDIVAEIKKIQTEQPKNIKTLKPEQERIIKKKLFRKYISKNKDYLEILKTKIMEEDTRDIPLGLRERIAIQEKLDKTHRKLKRGGKKHFTQQEALSLFLSIAVKEKIAKNLVDLSIRLDKLEYETLSLPIETLSEKEKNKNFPTLYNWIFNLIARVEESRLSGSVLKKENSTYKEIFNLIARVEESRLSGSVLNEETHKSAPVLLAKLTCNFRYEKEHEKLQFIYTSSNTYIENAISATAVHLGFNQDLENVSFLSTKVIDSRVDGLVEITVMLKNKKNLYQATWVDRDTIQAQIQAINCAAVYWISDIYQNSDNQSQKKSTEKSSQEYSDSNSQKKLNNNKFDLKKYQSICRTLSEVRTQLFSSKKTVNNFEFLDDRCQDDYIKNLSNKALAQLKEIPIFEKIPENTQQNTQKDVYISFRKNLLRCYLHAQLILLRKANTQGNIETAKEITKKIEPELEQYQDWFKADFSPIDNLLETEKYLYEFSLGKSQYVFRQSAKEKNTDLKNTVDRIIKNIGHNKFYKDLGLDIYHCLSEKYGNTARFNFYLSDEREILEKATLHFLIAAYYASRIGSNRRTAKWIVFAGRACIRLGNFDLANEAIYLSTTIIDMELSSQDANIFKDALKSEINLLKGEYELYSPKDKENSYPGENKILKTKEEKALYYFLLALKGSIYLGLTRRISDSLYNIFRAGKNINKTVKHFLNSGEKNINPFLDYQDNICAQNRPEIRIKKDDSINPQGNQASSMALDLLDELLSEPKNDTWANVANQFLDQAQSIWQNWYSQQDEAQSHENKHPVVSRLKSEKWLSVIEE